MAISNLPDDFTLCMDFMKSLKKTAGIPEKNLEKMVEEAIAIGEDLATGYIGANIIDVAKTYGITLNMVEGGVFGNRLMRAQYDDDDKVITVYEDGINNVLMKSGAVLLGVELSCDKVREVFLWHEFFHVLEFNEIGLIGDRYKVPAKLLCFSYKRPLYEISEVSANAFAKKVMGLKCNPFILDYISKYDILVESEEKADENR